MWTDKQTNELRYFLARVEWHGQMTVNRDSYAAVYLEALRKDGALAVADAKYAGYVTYRPVEVQA
jgi:hypothetical protein